MFEVGRRYRLTTSDHDGTGYHTAKVIEWAHPLLKVEKLGSYEIINTAAAQFVSAEPVDEESRTAKAK